MAPTSVSTELALPPPNLPTLRPDQTLYSWCGEVHRWNGNPIGIDTSLQLFGSPRAGFFHDFPAHLDALVERTAGAIGDTRTLACGHTLLGYYLPFVPTRRAQEMLAGVSESKLVRLKFHLALPKSGIGASHPLKGCDACFGEDESAGRLPYWRLEHQWPSVLICRAHGRLLSVAADSYTPIHRRDWLLPRLGPARQWIQPPALGAEGREVLMRLAHLSAAVAGQEPSALSPDRVARTYRTAFLAEGFVLKSGDVSDERLGARLRQRFAALADVPSLASLVRPAKGASAWWRPALMEATAMHPVKHLLLIDLLFTDWPAFEAALVDAEGGGTVNPVSTSAPVEPADDPRMTKFASLVQGGLSISAAARSMGFTASTGVRWAKLLGIPYTPRTKSIGHETLQCVRRLLAEGRSKAEVVSASGMSLFSLNRLISSEPGVRHAWIEARMADGRATYRQHFLEVLQRHSGLPLSAIRLLPGNGYHWLYRNDRQWLEENLPAIWRAPSSDDC